MSGICGHCTSGAGAPARHPQGCRSVTGPRHGRTRQHAWPPSACRGQLGQQLCPGGFRVVTNAGADAGSQWTTCTCTCWAAGIWRGPRAKRQPPPGDPLSAILELACPRAAAESGTCGFMRTAHGVAAGRCRPASTASNAGSPRRSSSCGSVRATFKKKQRWCAASFSSASASPRSPARSAASAAA